MRRIKLPGIGFRIVKSAVAIALCYVISFLRGNGGIVFYSHIAALWCIQMYAVGTKKNAMQRIVGTVIGAVYGLIFLLEIHQMHVPAQYGEYVDAAVISLMIIVVLYTTVLIKRKQASYFSCVVFLSIVVNHVGDANPYLFVWNRFLDTIVGIIVGIAVNSFSLPKEKHKDILFVSALDDTLLTGHGHMTDYSKFELNRMLDEGIQFTVSTMRTPASMMKPMQDIRLKLPVIAMDGAVLYDFHTNEYKRVYVISNATAGKILALIREAGLQYYINVVIDDLLVIYYESLKDEVNEQMVNKLRTSPYRNYVQRNLPNTDEVVYFMLLDKKERIEAFYRVLKREKITEELKVFCYPSKDYDGYSYIKIYNKNATKENMVSQLKQMTGLEKTITFGSIEGKYDVVVQNGDRNEVVRRLKKYYEPVKNPLKRRKAKKEQRV